MFILKKGHQPGVYVPLRALFLVNSDLNLPQILKVPPYNILSSTANATLFFALIF